MAHEVYSMAYVGETPWHGLGNQLTPKQSIDVWAEQAGMDWRIESAEVRYYANHTTGGQLIMPFADNKVLYRSDTLEPLSVVSQRYQEVQPREILEFYRDLTEQADFELETAGVLKGGRKFWALARTGQTTALKGKDVSNGYILLATGCDGTLATTAQFTAIRVVCNNTLAISLADKSGSVVKVPHSTVFDAQKVKNQLGISVQQWEEYMYQMKQLSERRVTQREAANYLNRVFNNADNDILVFPTRNNKAEQAVPNAKAMNQVMNLFNGQGRGADLD